MALIKHHDKAALNDRYSPGSFLLQSASLSAFFILLFLICLKLLAAGEMALLLSLPAFFLGAIITDFFSGIVHWGLDTWGTVETPVFGKKLIRDFRVHHMDEKDITMHGFIPTIGPSAVGAVVLELIAFLIPLSAPVGIFFAAFFAAVGFWTLMTNQIHKWAHMDIEKIPLVPRFFQKIRLFLAPEPHHVHHVEPFTQSYCITTGWMNPLMTRTQFFRQLERLVVSLTGAIPRADDIGIEAATELAKAEHIIDNDETSPEALISNQ